MRRIWSVTIGSVAIIPYQVVSDGGTRNVMEEDFPVLGTVLEGKVNRWFGVHHQRRADGIGIGTSVGIGNLQAYRVGSQGAEHVGWIGIRRAV